MAADRTGATPPWEQPMREEWAADPPTALLDEIMRLRRGMEGVRSRHLRGHHDAAESLHCWTWNGSDPDAWEPVGYGESDERAYRSGS